MTLALKLGREHAETLAPPRTARRFRARTPLYSGEDLALFAHLSTREALCGGLAGLCAELRMGAVYCTTPKHAREVAALHRLVGGSHALFDRDLYSGKDRIYAAHHDLDPDWVATQLQLGFDFGLTDSGFVPADDLEGLNRTLGQASTIRGAIAALPLGSKWVSEHPDELAAAINRAGIPAALMLEHSNDPFGVAKAVTGLLTVLQNSDVPILLLRSDTSAIGALAYGAAHAAIGTSTSRRHIFPAKSGGGGPGPRELSAYVLSAMAYRKLSTINHAIAASQEDDIPWTCWLPCCNGARLDHLTGPDAVSRHSLTSQEDLLSTVLLDPSIAVSAWHAKCTHALSVNQEMNSKIRSTWPVPDFLSAWRSANAR